MTSFPQIMELSWTSPALPSSLACHETGSLVVQIRIPPLIRFIFLQHALEKLEGNTKDRIVDKLLGQGAAAFGEVAKSQRGSYCVPHILEHGSEKHRRMALEHLLEGLLEFATNEQGSKSVVKALKEGEKKRLNRVVQRMCDLAKGARCATMMALSRAISV
ncbi:hypothetical protein B0H14DRAFT_3607972 [Mycena olivaceomarginata]|nr:hypothetical protein B0H14DRAFT_3607972 [Mycena olivaceomarginata]